MPRPVAPQHSPTPTVTRRGLLDWQILDEIGEPMACRFLTRRAALRYAARRWPA